MLLATAYFPPVEYFALLAGYSTVFIEACENYQKQSWRNRCRILTASGPEYLSFPVVHEGGTFSLPIKEIKVDYSTPWVVRTERCLETAYLSSPFFEYYRDELFSILDSHPETLWGLNMGIIRTLCRKTGISPEIIETASFTAPVPPGAAADPEWPGGAVGGDYRNLLHPKSENCVLKDMGLGKPYYQVFGRRFGFVPGLSVVDLLFNEGPESICLLRQSFSCVSEK